MYFGEIYLFQNSLLQPPIWDGSTKISPVQIVLNEQTSMEFEAIIDFGTAKMRLLISIYNWRISFPKETIYVALADMTACFLFL
jgi:hypothetical protein